MMSRIDTKRHRRGVSRAAGLLLTVLFCVTAAASPARADFHVESGSFTSNILDAAGSPISPAQAGGRPDGQRVTFSLGTHMNEYSLGGVDPDGALRDAITELPPGLIGNPQAIPICPGESYPPQELGGYSGCPTASQIGVARVKFGTGSGLPSEQTVPVFNLQAPHGVVARIGFVLVVPVVIDISLRTNGDYGIDAAARQISTSVNFYETEVTLWGVPADPAHDAQRFKPRAFAPGNGSGGPLASDQPLRPFLTNPTRCGVDLSTGLKVDSWEAPGNFLSYKSPPMSFFGCDRLDFEPSIRTATTTDAGDAPSGLDFRLHLPQNEGLAQNEIQSLTVKATEGTYKLAFDGESATAFGIEAMSAAFMQQTLESIPAIGAGNVAVTGGPPDATGSKPYTIVFRGAFSHQDVEQLKVEEAGSLQITTSSGSVPGSAAVTTTTQGSTEGPEGSELATAELRDATVRLPDGLVVNPSAAGVQQACSLEQIGISMAGIPNEEPVTCPDASVLGTASVLTPALDHPLPGTVYLARQDENPFHSLLAIYLVIDDPISGVLIKLAGKIEADPQTGQLTTSFIENPQLPVEDLELHLFGGDNAPLRTPLTCGVKSTTSDMVPWTAPEGETKHPEASFAITHGCSASEAGAPNSPSFEAGTTGNGAGAYSPFVLKLSRADGSQQLTGIDTTLPKGLLARLAGVPYCSDQDLTAAAQKSGRAEQSSPSCPSASRVGSVAVGAGAGPNPFYAKGAAYLAGPYKGAPLSLAVVTPAVAGPFDLGTVVVRNALYVDPVTAQVRAVSDPFPHILQGIPLDIRSIALTLDRSQFTKNPTSCEPFAVTGAAATLAGQSASLSQHFQVQGCDGLGFKPKLKLSFGNQTRRLANPAVKAVLTAPEGQANVAGATVILPRSEFIDQSHVNGPCTRVQFAADQCPVKSILGTARAYSPLLEKPLEGPVYFRSNGGERRLPDIVADLNGQIHVVLVGFVDSIKVGKEGSRVRTRFLDVPDAPVSRFELRLKGGRRGLIENTEDLCKAKPVANVQMTGQNGKISASKVTIGTECRGAKKSKEHGRHGRRSH